MCNYHSCTLGGPAHILHSVNLDYQPNMEPFGMRLALLRVDSRHCKGTLNIRHLTTAAGMELSGASSSQVFVIIMDSNERSIQTALIFLEGGEYQVENRKVLIHFSFLDFETE